jgi:hypothetical protein
MFVCTDLQVNDRSWTGRWKVAYMVESFRKALDARLLLFVPIVLELRSRKMEHP